MASTKKRPSTKKPAAQRTALEPAPGGPRAQHNPAVTAAFARKGFRLVNTGGDVMAYQISNPTVGEITVSDEGELPESMAAPVSVYFTGTEHSEHLIELRFASVSAFLATVRAGLAQPKRNDDPRRYHRAILERMDARAAWHSEVMLPRGGSFMAHVSPDAKRSDGWNISVDAEDLPDWRDAVRQYGQTTVQDMMLRSVNSDMEIALGERR